MNVHKNARLTPSGRVLMMKQIESGWPVRRAATASRPVRTAHRWLGRWPCGDRHLMDRSSEPRHCPNRTSQEQVAAIERLRRERPSGPSIARAVGMARSVSCCAVSA